jgi:hypothetical protein
MDQRLGPAVRSLELDAEPAPVVCFLPWEHLKEEGSKGEPHHDVGGWQGSVVWLGVDDERWRRFVLNVKVVQSAEGAS